MKNNIFKYLTAVSKNVYLYDLDDFVNKYNNIVHLTIKIKPIDVKFDSYAEYNVDSNVKNPKFKIGDHVRISKYKNIFPKGKIGNWSEEVFVISNIQNTFSWTYIINDLNGEDIIGNFYQKKLQKTNKKVIKRKGN